MSDDSDRVRDEDCSNILHYRRTKVRVEVTATIQVDADQTASRLYRDLNFPAHIFVF